MKTREQVELGIKELVTENFNSYEDDYVVEDGKSTEDSTITAQEVAIGYYDNRRANEVSRDEELGITKIDYVDWVMEAYSDWIHENKL